MYFDAGRSEKRARSQHHTYHARVGLFSKIHSDTHAQLLDHFEGRSGAKTHDKAHGLGYRVLTANELRPSPDNEVYGV
jgi:hypothetical protein